MTITLEQVQAEAAKVVETFGPKHKNPDDGDGCSYTNVDGEHCVAGQIAVNLGAPIPGLMDDSNFSNVYEVEMWRPLFTSDALTYLYTVQDLADSGYTWERAVRSVDA